MAGSATLRHIRNYASAGLVASLVGLVSFPLLTRNLSVEDYGVLGLVTSTLTLFVAFGKLGLQHAIVRFYAEIRHNHGAYSIAQLNTTVYAAFLLLAALATALWLLAGFRLLPAFLHYPRLPELFCVAAGLLFLRLMGSATINLLRAQQRSASVGYVQVIERSLYLMLVVALLLLGKLDPRFVLTALLVTECVAGALAIRAYWPDLILALHSFSASLLRALLWYGLPLMVLESLGLVLRLSDRYIIESLLGVGALGQYSASYNLTAYLEIVVIAGLMQAVRPMYTHLWEAEGSVATRTFLAQGLRLYLLIGLPVITIFSLTAPHLLILLSSPRYAPGTVIIPYVAISFLLDGAVIFLGAGLYLHKKTRVLMWWGGIASVTNIGLNLLLVPVFGLQGAAGVTVVSYLVFVIGITWASFTEVSFALQVGKPLLIALLCIAVYTGFSQLDRVGELTSLVLKGAGAGTILFLCVLWIEPEIRHWLGGLFPRLAEGEVR